MEYKPGSQVCFAHLPDVITKAIAMPNEIRTDDGRRLHVVNWEARVPNGDSVQLSIICTVSIPEEKQDEHIH